VGTNAVSNGTARLGRRTPRRLAAPLVIAMLAITGCGAGFNAQTNQVYQPADGVSDRSGDVYAINLLVVGNDEGDGTLIGTLINQQADDDALTEFTASAFDGTEILTSPIEEPVELTPQSGVALQDGSLLSLSGENLTPGDFINLTLTFDNAAALEMQIPIQPATDEIFSEVPIEGVEEPAA